MYGYKPTTDSLWRVKQIKMIVINNALILRPQTYMQLIYGTFIVV